VIAIRSKAADVFRVTILRRSLLLWRKVCSNGRQLRHVLSAVKQNRLCRRITYANPADADRMPTRVHVGLFLWVCRSLTTWRTTDRGPVAVRARSATPGISNEPSAREVILPAALEEGSRAPTRLILVRVITATALLSHRALANSDVQPHWVARTRLPIGLGAQMTNRAVSEHVPSLPGRGPSISRGCIYARHIRCARC
jgi:hypothetical protein